MADDEGPDSFNILPALLGKKTSGGWVGPSGKGTEPQTPGQLYDIDKDPYEKNDLWEKRPDIVKELTDLLEKYKKQGRSRPISS